MAAGPDLTIAVSNNGGIVYTSHNYNIKDADVSVESDIPLHSLKNKLKSLKRESNLECHGALTCCFHK